MDFISFGKKVLLADKQCGFKTGKPTTEAVMIQLKHIYGVLDDEKSSLIQVFSKTFTYINHERLSRVRVLASVCS